MTSNQPDITKPLPCKHSWKLGTVANTSC